MHPIALKIRCVHHPFSANGWQQRNWDGRKEKKHTLSWSEETVTTGTTSICTCTWTSHHRVKRKRKNILPKPTSTPFGLKYGANMCVHSEGRKEKKKRTWRHTSICHGCSQRAGKVLKRAWSPVIVLSFWATWCLGIWKEKHGHCAFKSR